MQAFTDMGFVFQTQQINTTEMLLNMSLIVPASADNNNTVFSCIAGTDTVRQRTESKPATLTVYEGKKNMSKCVTVCCVISF